MANAMTGSACGNPSLAARNPPSTAIETKTSLRVWRESEMRIWLWYSSPFFRS